MMLKSNLDDLHDKILRSIEFRWESGEVEIKISTGDPKYPHCVLAASDVSLINCNRLMPWENSDLINEVQLRRKSSTNEGAMLLETELQSGDLLCIEAKAISLLLPQEIVPKGNR